MPAPIPVEKVAKFNKLCDSGMTVKAAALEVGVSQQWGYLHRQGLKKRHGTAYARAEMKINGPKPKPASKLKPEAQRALVDFEYFRLRYCGRASLPWEVEAANKLLGAIKSDEKEYLVVNGPPGGGKTTLYTHDIPLWIICQDRSTRMIIGGAIQANAEKNVDRLRRSLSATRPYAPTDEDRAKGMREAEATVAGDFGRFAPDSQQPELWTRQAFSVVQIDGTSMADKEPTVQAFGRKGGVLGNRVRFCIWDDLVSFENVRTAEAREDLKQWWKEIAETRIDARGCMVLQGQRLSSDDLYRFALDMKGVVVDDEGYEVTDVEPPKKYKHIVYKAHYDDKCTGAHPKGMPAWPESCLLDPFKLPYKELLTKRKDDLDSYLALYQQEDADPSNALVRKLWLAGGEDPDTREMFPGCWDARRGLWELPNGLDGEIYVYATADPSPTMYWSVQAWAYHPSTQQFFLLDHARRKMTAPDLLDRDAYSRQFHGLMEDWQTTSVKLGIPIRTWVVEANAAQRFMLQYQHARLWQTKHGVSIIAHQTTNNKTDPKLGVEAALQPLFKSGRVRLPGRQGDGSRLAALKLTDEALAWPNGSTNDAVMSMWFGVWNLDLMYTPNVEPIRLHHGWRSINRGLTLVPGRAAV